MTSVFGMLEDMVHILINLDLSAQQVKVLVSFKAREPPRDPCNISIGLSRIPLNNICI